MRSCESQPVETTGNSLDKARRQYAQNYESWLDARRDRDDYLIPRNCSDERLRRLDQLTVQLVQMLPESATVVDLGFGPEGRDIADVLDLGASKNISVLGIELVPENIASALKNPRFKKQGTNVMEGRLKQGDITQGIPLPDNSIDAVILSSVIQHVQPSTFYTEIAPEIARVLKLNGILELFFKRKEGDNDVLTLKDATMGGVERSFYVYKSDDVVKRFQELRMKLYKGDEKMIGGVLLWDDQNRPIPYAGMYLIKSSQ